MSLWGRLQNLIHSILSHVGKKLHIPKKSLPFHSMLLSYWQIIVIDHKLSQSRLIRYHGELKSSLFYLLSKGRKLFGPSSQKWLSAILSQARPLVAWRNYIKVQNSGRLTPTSPWSFRSLCCPTRCWWAGCSTIQPTLLNRCLVFIHFY